MAEKKKFTRKQLDDAMNAVVNRFTQRSNITGFDVGYRWNEGKPTSDICVRIHVKEKLPESSLEAAEVFPEDIDGVPIDVIQGHYRISRVASSTDHRKRFKAVVGGISCGRPDAGTGTVGTIVFDETSGTPALLSNWHVLAGPNARSGDPILQPGTVDHLPEEENIVAHLSRYILDQDGDAAIARLIGSRPWYPIQFATNQMPEEIRDSRLGETLQKSGRTTGVTQGKVDGEGIYRIRYEVRPGVEENRDIRGFKIVTKQPGNSSNEELSSAGDSGSSWISDDGKHAVGLHFAGETNPDPAAEHAIACNMSAVSKRLKFRLATFDDLLDQAGPEMEFLKAQKWQDATLAKDLSVVPDWPEWPTGGPTPWPWPPYGPMPWPPRGPWGPYEAPGDWYQARGEPRRNFRAGMGRFFNRGLGGSAGSARTERLLPDSIISVRKDIWPRLKQALIGRSKDFRHVEPEDAFEDYLSPVRAKAFIAAAVQDHAPFTEDGLHALPSDFRGDTVFGHAAVSIGVLYEELGYRVRT